MADTFFTGLILFSLTAVTHCSKYCLTYNNRNYFNTKYEYCKYGCCKYANSSSCCSVNVGKIVGIVIGCLIAAGVIITIVVIICCCRRRRSQSGQVVTSSGTGATTMVTGVYPSGTTYPIQTAVVTGYGQPQQIAYSQNSNPQQPLQLGTHQMAPIDQTKYSQPPPAYDSLH